MTEAAIGAEAKSESTKLDKPQRTAEEEQAEEELKLSPEEQAELLRESNELKSEANALFTSDSIQAALDRYNDALAVLPKSQLFARAVLHSNIAACQLKLEEWKDAASAATKAIDALVDLEARDLGIKPASDAKKASAQANDQKEEEEAEEEIISAGAERSAPAPSADSDLKASILRIRIKSLLRRARANANGGTWHGLSSAEQDYKALEALPRGSLTAADARTVRTQLRDLPPKTKAAQEREVGEMWGKLRDLGDGLLKPFGLSTNNFQMVKDENSGGYSMNFKQSGD